MPKVAKKDDGFTVGGHDGGVRPERKVVLKAKQAGARGAAEGIFLDKAKQHPFLSKVVVQYYGDRKDEEGNEWLILENLLHGMASAVAMDLKMGSRTYAEDASQAKIEEQKGKASGTTTESLGVRVVGARIPQEDGLTSEIVGSKFKVGEPENEHEMGVLLKKFLRTEKLRAQALDFVRELTDWFNDQTEYAFYGSSLFLAYDLSLGSDAELVVKMIDFAHVNGGEKGRPLDESYLFGLQSLLRILSEQPKISRPEYADETAEARNYLRELLLHPAGSKQRATCLVFVRHGNTDRPQSDSRQADIDRKLTNKGRDQARRARSWTEKLPKPKLVCCSSAGRCISTASYMLGAVEPIILEGIYEGTMEEDCRAAFKDIGYASLESYLGKGHEKMMEKYAERVMVELMSALKISRKEDLGTVFVFGHAVFSSAMAKYVVDILELSGEGKHVVTSVSHGEADAFLVSSKGAAYLCSDMDSMEQEIRGASLETLEGLGFAGPATCTGQGTSRDHLVDE